MNIWNNNHISHDFSGGMSCLIWREILRARMELSQKVRIEHTKNNSITQSIIPEIEYNDIVTDLPSSKHINLPNGLFPKNRNDLPFSYASAVAGSDYHNGFN